jgi:hypothetical protein
LVSDRDEAPGNKLSNPDPGQQRRQTAKGMPDYLLTCRKKSRSTSPESNWDPTKRRPVLFGSCERLSRDIFGKMADGGCGVSKQGGLKGCNWEVCGASEHRLNLCVRLRVRSRVGP